MNHVSQLRWVGSHRSALEEQLWLSHGSCFGEKTRYFPAGLASGRSPLLRGQTRGPGLFRSSLLVPRHERWGGEGVKERRTKSLGTVHYSYCFLRNVCVCEDLSEKNTGEGCSKACNGR